MTGVKERRNAMEHLIYRGEMTRQQESKEVYR